MEQKYFLQKNNEKQGPFSVKELEERKISRADLVWYHGLDKWKKAKDVQELDVLFKFTPPPLNNNSLLSYKSLLKNGKLEIDKSKVLSFLRCLRKSTLFSVLAWLIVFPISLFLNTYGMRSSYYSYALEKSHRYSFWIAITIFILFFAVPYLKKKVIIK